MTQLLESRLARLETAAALHRLKAEYAAAADQKYLPTHCPAPPAIFAAAARRQADCFAQDALWEGGGFGGTRRGRAALLEFFMETTWRFATHLYAAPRLRIEDDTAQGDWRLWQIGLRRAGGPVQLLCGQTREFYVREQGFWRIARLSFTELHEVTLADSTTLRALIPAGAA